MITRILLATWLFAVSAGLSSAIAASFPCDKAQTFLEKGICSDDSLSQLDERLDAVYRRALTNSRNASELKSEQRNWLSGTRNKCVDAACLTRVYLARIATLEHEAGPTTESAIAPAAASSCAFPGLVLPKEFLVFAAGAYSGRVLPYQIDQSGHEGTQFDVAVHNPGIPVVLILGAYEPTIWAVKWSPQTQIAAVLITGYHRQAIAGLDPKVPLLNSSYDNRGACGYNYVSKDSLGGLNPLSRTLFGKPVDLVYTTDARRNGRIVIGETLADDAYVSSDAVSPESFIDRSAPLAGELGLLDAVNKGQLRKATEADADAWVQALMANPPKPDLPLVAGVGRAEPPRPYIFKAYVVLKEFRYPAGLYGGNSASFFVPKGVPLPTGNPGHSQVYDFNSLKCRGPGCGLR